MTASRRSENRGTTAIDERVITTIITEAVDRVPGTVHLERLGRRSYPRVDSHVDSEFRTCSVEVFIASVFPAPVTTVAEAVRRSVAGAIQTYTDYTCESVSVVVGTVVTGEGTVSAAELQQFDPAPVPTPVGTTRTTQLRDINTRPLYPDHAGIPVSTQPRAELAPIVTTPRPSLTPVSASARPEVTSVSAPRRAPARSVSAPRRIPARTVSAPTPLSKRGLTPVSVAPRPKPVSVRAPQPVTPIPVSAPQRRAPRPITINRTVSARTVSAPGVRNPRSVKAPGVNVRPVSAPGAKALKPVQRPSSHTPRPVVVERPDIKPVTAAKRRNLR